MDRLYYSSPVQLPPDYQSDLPGVESVPVTDTLHLSEVVSVPDHSG